MKLQFSQIIISSPIVAHDDSGGDHNYPSLYYYPFIIIQFYNSQSTK